MRQQDRILVSVATASPQKVKFVMSPLSLASVSWFPLLAIWKHAMHLCRTGGVFLFGVG